MIEDEGSGLRLRHLLFGVSEKKDGARGRFGEGLKIALIVLKRLGYTVTIKSNGLEVKTDSTEIQGEKVLKLRWREVKNGITGTHVIIHGWHDLQETFEDRFTFRREPTYKNKIGSVFDDGEHKLYCKGIFVCDLPNAEFSYDLENLRLEETRNIASEYSLNSALGYLMKYCDDKAIIKRWMQAFASGKREKDADFWGRPNRSDLWLEAFIKTYGANAVLGTKEDMKREAKWLGKTVVDNPCPALEGLFNILPTDKQVIREHYQSNDRPVRVRGERRKILMKLEKYAKMINPKVEVKAYYLEKDNGKWRASTNTIMINVEVLDNIGDALEVVIHEVAHSLHDYDDMTPEMMREVAYVGAKMVIVTNPAWRAWRTRKGSYD